jgi:cystathionine beta-lyase/cystathionine gamma-synthase
MEREQVVSFVKKVVENMPLDWLHLTTHRLDIYNESLAKVEFLDQFESLFNQNNYTSSALAELPTAYDYIRLGHPLSSVLEWAIAKSNDLEPQQVISFSSNTMPIMAILRKNLLLGKHTHIFYSNEVPKCFNAPILKEVYGYNFDLIDSTKSSVDPDFVGSTVLISKGKEMGNIDDGENYDFYININEELGSVILVNGEENERFFAEIQHVRRRETIAMTPANCFIALQSMVGKVEENQPNHTSPHKASVKAMINDITQAPSKAIVGSSGLSVQYAIMMGLVHHAQIHHPNKGIKFIVPTNCYGGTNDQARRVAAVVDRAEVVDLAVDREHDMVESIDAVLDQMADENSVPYIIAEIPTNPRVEVPIMSDLKAALQKERTTKSGEKAIDPVFILDQTFCPNMHFLREEDTLSNVRTISYVSGSKFPSGGRCTAGYAVANAKASGLMEHIELHLEVCDNEATNLQYKILAEQMPTMIQRISDAYANTRDFVNFIGETLPGAKINFVSEELAGHGFTPSVFSLDLPTKGDTAEEKEAYKRALNHKLIKMMITQIPNESKYCVSYGQLKGCYWTIPATSTQGTTKEGDKDYIARVAVSGDLDLEKHKAVFAEFVEGI